MLCGIYALRELGSIGMLLEVGINPKLGKMPLLG